MTQNFIYSQSNFIAREDILEEIDEFVSSREKPNVLYLQGEGGAGKSWLARAVEEKIMRQADKNNFTSRIELQDESLKTSDIDDYLRILNGRKASFVGGPDFQRYMYALGYYYKKSDPSLARATRPPGILAEYAEKVGDVLDAGIVQFVEFSLENFSNIGKLFKEGKEIWDVRELKKRHHELLHLDRFDGSELLARIQQYFRADLNRWLDCPSSVRRAVLIIDNIDGLGADARDGARVRALRDLCRECRNVRVILLGRQDLNEVLGMGGQDLVPHKVLQVEQLSVRNAAIMLSKLEVAPQTIIDKICHGNRLPLVLRLKAEWVKNFGRSFGRVPMPEEVPEQLPEVFDRLLKFYNRDQRRLMWVLAAAGTFDEALVHHLVKLPDMSLASSDCAAVYRNASVVEGEDGKLRFHDLLRDHLLNSEKSGSLTRGAEDRASLLHHVLDYLSEDGGIPALMQAVEMIGAQPEFWSGRKAIAGGEKLLRAISHSVLYARAAGERQADGLVRSTIRVLCLCTPEVKKLISDVVSSPEREVRRDAFSMRFCEFADIAFQTLTDPYMADDPQLALSMHELLSEVLTELAIGEASDWIKAEQASAALWLSIAHRRLPLERVDGLASANQSDHYIQNLAHYGRALAEAVEHGHCFPERESALSLRAAWALSESCRVSKKRVGRDVESLNEEHELASSLFQRVAKVETTPQSKFLWANHMLTPPPGMPVAIDELDTANNLLKELVAEEWRLGAVLPLLIRAAIRKSLKVRDGEIKTDTDPVAYLERAESYLLNLSEAFWSVERATGVRLLLRLLRKRAELGGGDSPNLHRIGEELLKLCRDVGQVNDLLLRSILYEMSNAIREKRLSCPEALSELFRQTQRGDLSEWCVFQILKTLLSVVPDGDFTQPIQREVVLNAIARMPSLAYTQEGGVLLQKAKAELIGKAAKPLLDQCLQGELDEFLKLPESFLQNAVSREATTELMAMLMDIGRELIKRGAQTLAVKFFKKLDGFAHKHCLHDADFARNINEILLDTLYDQLEPHEIRNFERRRKALAKVREKPQPIGSLWYNAKEFARGRNKKPDGHSAKIEAQLIFEACAIIEEQPDVDLKLRRLIRRSFLAGVFRRAARINLRVIGSSEPSTEALCIPSDAFSRIGEDPSGQLIDELLAVLARLPVEEPKPGNFAVAEFVGMRENGENTHAEFSFGNRTVFVQKGLLSINAYQMYCKSDSVNMLEDVGGSNEELVDEESSRPMPKHHLINFITSDGGQFQASMRGEKFVANALQLFLPGVHPGMRVIQGRGDGFNWITMGASNSWVVARVHPKVMTAALAGGGTILRMLSSLLGLRRLTLVPIALDGSDAALQYEMRNFINNSWSELKVDEVTPEYVEIDLAALNTNSAPRKRRTFESMFRKLYPDVALNFRNESPTVTAPDNKFVTEELEWFDDL